MHKYFLTTYRYTKGKIHRKLCILQKGDLYQNQFSNKKGVIAKPESPKKHPIWAAHPRTHLSTKYPPRKNFTVDVLSLCVPERTGTGESAAISENVSAIFTILLFDLLRLIP